MTPRLLFQTFIISGLMGSGIVAIASTPTSAPREVTLRSNGTAADVAVSVIDNKLATAEKDNTILTSMLLNSDLRGSVEDAGWYFPDSLTTKHHQAIDGLMLTQGWSRYDIPAALDGKAQYVSSELEIGPSIGGVVKSRWMGKPMKDVMVLALAPTIGYGGQAITDEKGEFLFSEKDFPEGTKFIFQALNEKGGNEGNFDITPESYPTITPLESLNVASYKQPSSSETESTDYNWRITHSNGMMNIMLGEVKVVQKKLSDYDNPMELMARGTIDYKEIEKQKLTTIEDIIRTIPGIVVVDNNAYYQNRLVEIWVDDRPWEGAATVGFDEKRPTGGIIALTQMGAMPKGSIAHPSQGSGWGSFGGTLNYSIASPSEVSALGNVNQVLPVDFIKKVQHFPPYVSLLFNPGPTTNFRSTGGIIMITTKDGMEKVSRPDWRLRYATPLGYQRRKEFYTPKYELMADYEINNRPTLYWIPSATVDRFGNLSLPIPASVSDYTFIAEGIDADGNPVRITKSFKE